MKLMWQGAVFGTDNSKLRSEPLETDAETILREWHSDGEAQELAKLAHALGLEEEIILADRDMDENDLTGQYFCAPDGSEAHSRSLKPWHLSPDQLATANRALCNGRDVILLSYQSSGDFPATLAHEIGHLINRRLVRLTRFELYFSPVTESMRRTACFDEYFLKNKDEYYAESWSRFLCGDENRVLFRYLQRSLERVRIEHPAKARLIEEHRSRTTNSFNR